MKTNVARTLRLSMVAMVVLIAIGAAVSTVSFHQITERLKIVTKDVLPTFKQAGEITELVRRIQRIAQGSPSAVLPDLLALSLSDGGGHQAGDAALDRGLENGADDGLADGAAEHAERLRRQGAGRRRGQHPAPRCTAGRHCPQRGNGGGGVVRRQAMRPHDRDQRMG